MASRQKKSGGDFILESRHLVGLFLLLVFIFGVVFTLGYLLGRSQYDSRLRAAVGVPPGSDGVTAPAAKTKGRPAAPVNEDEPAPPKNSDWDFYHSAEPQAADDHLQPPSKPVAVAAKPAAAPNPAPPSAKVTKTKGSSDLGGPQIPRGAVVLQVAAVRRQDDALALAQALQQKKFPAFVVAPGPNKFYRVQVGPYADNPSAAKARTELQAKGFKSIIKR